MKLSLNIFLCLASILFFDTNLFGQFNKSDLYLDADVAYNHTDNSDQLARTIEMSEYYSVRSTVGYLINKSFMLGLSVHSTKTKKETQSQFELIRPFGINNRIDNFITEESSEFSLALVGRYQKRLADKLYGFASISASIGSKNGSAKQESEYIRGFSEYQNSFYDFALAPGLTYFIGQQAGIKVTFGRLLYRDEVGFGSTKTEEFDVSLRPSDWRLGVFYRFRLNEVKE